MCQLLCCASGLQPLTWFVCGMSCATAAGMLWHERDLRRPARHMMLFAKHNDQTRVVCVLCVQRACCGMGGTSGSTGGCCHPPWSCWGRAQVQDMMLTNDDLNALYQASYTTGKVVPLPYFSCVIRQSGCC